jgi:hypothetical protein
VQAFERHYEVSVIGAARRIGRRSPASNRSTMRIKDCPQRAHAGFAGEPDA